MFRRISAPISVQWELTSACNLNCVHCYNYWRDGSSRKNIMVDCNNPSPEIIAKELVDNGVFHVTLTGGEPLTVLKKSMGGLVQLRKAGVDINVNSNLVLLNNEHLSMLKELGVRSILTSLMAFDARIHDALSGVSGSFEATCAGIRKAIENGLRVAVNMVVTKKNLQLIRATGRFVKSLGAVGFCATKANTPSSCHDFTEYRLNLDGLHSLLTDLLAVKEDTGLDIDSLDHYPACAFPNSETRLAIGDRNCSAGRTGCTVGFNGCVRPCSQAQQTYGNISDGLRSAWFAMDEWRSGTLVPDRCKKECGEFPTRCGGGCRVEASNCTGVINGHDPYCVGGSPPKRIIKHSTSVNISDVFVPVQTLRFRREDVGHVAYSSVKNWLLVDDVLAGFLKGDRAVGGGFTATDLSVAYGIAVERIYPTLRLLVSKKLVNAGGRESRQEEVKLWKFLESSP